MDRERASDLVREIGAEIVRGTDFVAHPWETIVVVADYHQGRRRLFGYWFSDDDWEAATPDGFRALLLFGDLRDAMTGPGHAPWDKALMRIRRGAPGIGTGIEVELEFDDTGERWVPTPADPEGFARGLLAPGAGNRPPHVTP